MKTTYKYGVLILSSLLLASCTFLDTDPNVIVDKGQYYSTPAKVRSGLAGVYGVMSAYELYGGVYSVMISGTDDLCYFNNYTDPASRVERNNHTASTEEVYMAWAKIYEGIKNANEFMKALSSPSFDRAKLDPQDFNYNQARFLRAYYHFLLAQSWGDVPLRTEPVSSVNPEDLKLAATPQARVLQWCIAEMEEIIGSDDKAGLSNDLTFAPSQITLATGQGLLARVYLFLAGESVANKAQLGIADNQTLYAKAAFWAKKVIDDARHQLNGSYSDVFINMISDKYDRMSNESMFEVEFKGDRSTPDRWTNGRIGDINGLKSQSQRSNYSEWACNYAYGQYNGNYKLWELYRDADLIAADKVTSDAVVSKDSRQIWNLPPYNYAGAVNRKVSSIEIATQKKDNSVVNILQSMYPVPYFSSTSISLPFAQLEGIDMSIDKALDVKTHSVTLDVTLSAGVRNSGKFRREAIYEGHVVGKNLFTAINFPILRYADVLLMYAEASNIAEGTPNILAVECVRKVRERAGLKLDIAQTGSFASFEKLVRNERGRELAFEGLRRYDLIRWGLFVDAMHAAAAFPPQNKYMNGAINQFASVAYLNVQPKHIFLPIPTKELSGNRLIKQNHLW